MFLILKKHAKPCIQSPEPGAARADHAAEVDVAVVLADALDRARVDCGGDAAPQDQRVARAAGLPAAVRPGPGHLRKSIH